ncbi:MAG: hypothetical protein K2N67_04610 [Mucispirillum sp.]|nr:hypothetical protein [Mucispirillum sp.]
MLSTLPSFTNTSTSSAFPSTLHKIGKSYSCVTVATLFGVNALLDGASTMGI